MSNQESPVPMAALCCDLQDTDVKVLPYALLSVTNRHATDVTLHGSFRVCKTDFGHPLQALLLAQQGWQVNVYDSRPRPGNAWDAHTMKHAQNVVLGRRAQLCLARADALAQVLLLLEMSDEQFAHDNGLPLPDTPCMAASGRLPASVWALALRTLYVVQVTDSSVRLLGQIAVAQSGRDTSVRYSFAALSISEPDLAGALIRVGQERYPQQVSSLLSSLAVRACSRDVSPSTSSVISVSSAKSA